MEHLRCFLGLVSKHELRLKKSKCDCLKGETALIGHIDSPRGMSVSTNKEEAIRNASFPHDGRLLKSFLGWASYYRCFNKGSADIPAGLYPMTSEAAHFNWTESIEKAFDEIKEKLINPPSSIFLNSKIHFLWEPRHQLWLLSCSVSAERGWKSSS